MKLSRRGLSKHDIKLKGSSMRKYYRKVWNDMLFEWIKNCKAFVSKMVSIGVSYEQLEYFESQEKVIRNAVSEKVIESVETIRVLAYYVSD